MSTTIPTQVTQSQPPPQRGGQRGHQGHPRPTFTIACWLMALLAFAQLITVGTALTVRNEPAKPQYVASTKPTVSAPQEPIQTRSLEEILASVGDDPIPAIDSTAHTPVRIPARILADVAPAPAARNLPVIADPRVERLVQESRSLHMDGDMMRSMLKLDEAQRIDPTEPAVTYQKALLFEDMGIFVQAADHYQKIQQMGIKAGAYYHLAATKLMEGMDVRGAKRPVISIGPMKTRKGNGLNAGKQADVSITILARPDEVINPADVHVQIHFYDRVNGGEIKKATASAEITSSWGDTKLDWKDAGNEETLRVSYSIPEDDLADEHLLGRREFYGYVIELLYKGDVIDQQAQPRRLHSVHGTKMAPIPEQGPPMPWLPGDDNTLLPSKDPNYGGNMAFPPLPTR